MKFSLVVATVERTQELRAFLCGLATQQYRNFEVILVDQNGDDRLKSIIGEAASNFPVQHLRSPIRNCCHGRNLGIEAATGDVLGFPDDDCLYQPDTLMRVRQHFEEQPDLALLTGNCVTPEGELANGRWTTQSCEITERNVWTTLQGFSMWIRTETARKVGGFDTSIGPGTPWGSSEEPDFALRVLRKGYRGYYDVTIGILHPDKFMTPWAIKRARLYGAGMGRVLRKHAISPWVALPYFVRPAGGLAVSLFRGQRSHMRYYLDTLRGRVAGYLSKI